MLISNPLIPHSTGSRTRIQSAEAMRERTRSPTRTVGVHRKSEGPASSVGGESVDPSGPGRPRDAMQGVHERHQAHGQGNEVVGQLYMAAGDNQEYPGSSQGYSPIEESSHQG